MPSISLDGKTLQTLLEAKKFPQNIIYNKNNLKLYYPQKKDIIKLIRHASNNYQFNN